MPMDLLKIMKMPLVTKNRKYSRNSDRKQIKNTKGLTKGQKITQKTLKNFRKIISTFLTNF